MKDLNVGDKVSVDLDAEYLGSSIREDARRMPGHQYAGMVKDKAFEIARMSGTHSDGNRFYDIKGGPSATVYTGVWAGRLTPALPAPPTPKFKKGDVVLALSGKPDGRYGRVTSTGPSFVGKDWCVDFGSSFDGHDGRDYSQEAHPAKTGKGSHWWMPESTLRLIMRDGNSVIIVDHAPIKIEVPVQKKSVKQPVKVNEQGQPILTKQTKKILELLREKGSVTSLEVAGVLRARSLSRRVCDLKDAGYTVRTVLSKDVTGQRYARYYLHEKAAA